MRITALVENQSEQDLKNKHGLSLFIETKNHNILFDLGPNGTLFHNASLRNIDLTKIDTVIISHGHMDHGGALKHFLEINHTARIYIQRSAFENHSSKFMCFYVNVGIDKKLMTHPQVVLLDGDAVIDQELSVFTVDQDSTCYSNANDSLYENRAKDHFHHEQNLMIYENVNALVMGCGHTGIVNIMNKANEYKPEICVGGYHLYNPLTKRCVPHSLLTEIINNLKQYQDIEFYTCHCTGLEAYRFMAERMKNMHYLSCGSQITF